MNLIAIVNDSEEIIETMWGDPNRWDDWQRRIFKIFISLCGRDREKGYSLERLDLYETSVNPGDGSIEKRGENPLGIREDSIIVIKGPLYRADTYAFLKFELTEEENPVFAIPFRSYSAPKTIEIEYYDGDMKKDRRKRLIPLSMKTANHAIGYLPENPIALPTSDRSPPAGWEIVKEIEEKGIAHVRRKYFS